ncbi:hypothetical protein ACFP2T_13080 [Plantactinospora solaniradicis]|uniref:EcsC family protein n=1 Tax=Plantactinospora solaniradicis TaxID=1723736 RepID=A0ABW1K8E9_9ACTN
MMSRSDQAPDAPSPASTGTGGAADPTPGSELVPRDEELGATVAALTDDDLGRGGRRRLLGRLVGQVRARGTSSLFKPKAALRWLTDTVAEIAPHVPIRDRETLRRHFDGLDGDALAARLVRNAVRATAGVGAAGGGVAAVEWVATPTLLSAPVLLAAETVAVVAIELKLIGELHEAYGVQVPGTAGQRAMVLLRSWAAQRGVNPLVPGVGVGAVLGTAARNELRDRLLRRFGRNLTTLGPFLTGAAVAGFLNGRATRGLGNRIREDLRPHPPAIGD